MQREIHTGRQAAGRRNATVLQRRPGDGLVVTPETRQAIVALRHPPACGLDQERRLPRCDAQRITSLGIAAHDFAAVRHYDSGDPRLAGIESAIAVAIGEDPPGLEIRRHGHR